MMKRPCTCEWKEEIQLTVSLLAQLDGPLLDDAESLEIVNETAVIIGALANGACSV